jgi:hypothetical protein
MLESTIIVASPDRFARDLMVQLARHDMLKARRDYLRRAARDSAFSVVEVMDLQHAMEAAEQPGDLLLRWIGRQPRR